MGTADSYPSLHRETSVIHQAGRSLTLFIHCQQARGKHLSFFLKPIYLDSWSLIYQRAETATFTSGTPPPPWPWISQLPCQNVNKTYINLIGRQKLRDPPWVISVHVIPNQFHLGRVPLWPCVLSICLTLPPRYPSPELGPPRQGGLTKTLFKSFEPQSHQSGLDCPGHSVSGHIIQVGDSLLSASTSYIPCDSLPCKYFLPTLQ